MKGILYLQFCISDFLLLQNTFFLLKMLIRQLLLLDQ